MRQVDIMLTAAGIYRYVAAVYSFASRRDVWERQ